MAADLFGLEQEQPRRLYRKEAAALVKMLQALRLHIAVALIERVKPRAARMLFVILGRKMGLSDEQLIGTAEKAAGMTGPDDQEGMVDEQGPPQPGDADPEMGGAERSGNVTGPHGQQEKVGNVTDLPAEPIPPNPDDARKGAMR